MFQDELVNLLLIAAVFAPLERLAPISRGRALLREHTMLDLCHYFISGLLIKGGILLLAAVAVLSARRMMPDEAIGLIQSQPLWLQFIETIVVADLVFYAVHRAFHSVPALWRIHSIHHSIEEMDWLAAHRVHPIDQMFTKGLSVAAIVILGFSPAAMIAFAALYKWQSLFIHSNVKFDFGPLGWLLATPHFHHWHHSNDAVARDRNFAGQLPAIDFLFGTAHMPAGKMPERYGVDEPPPMTYLGQLFHPFKGRAKREALHAGGVAGNAA